MGLIPTPLGDADPAGSDAARKPRHALQRSTGAPKSASARLTHRADSRGSTAAPPKECRARERPLLMERRPGFPLPATRGPRGAASSEEKTTVREVSSAPRKEPPIWSGRLVRHPPKRTPFQTPVVSIPKEAPQGPSPVRAPERTRSIDVDLARPESRTVSLRPPAPPRGGDPPTWAVRSRETALPTGSPRPEDRGRRPPQPLPKKQPRTGSEPPKRPEPAPAARVTPKSSAACRLVVPPEGGPV